MSSKHKTVFQGEEVYIYLEQELQLASVWDYYVSSPKCAESQEIQKQLTYCFHPDTTGERFSSTLHHLVDIHEHPPL